MDYVADIDMENHLQAPRQLQYLRSFCLKMYKSLYQNLLETQIHASV